MRSKGSSDMYFVLDCEPPEDDEGGMFEIDDQVEIDEIENWSSGCRLDVHLSKPIVIDVTPIRGYRGGLSDMYDDSLCLMSIRMVKTLQQIGVNNLELYPATLRNTKVDQSWSYYVVNILGLVAAADLTRSEWTCDTDPPKGNVHFQKLVIDPNAVCGLLLFRLSYDPCTILIHESVRTHLEKAGLQGLSYEKPENWQT